MSNEKENKNKQMIGVYLKSAGVITAGVGLPVWINGTMRKKEINVALIKYNSVETPSPTCFISGI